ncbi:MAG TPA: RNA polymerase sigma-54 factor [Phycisphaeraceae bacterium]|nr:RNA polymerase sigma-54 factor [Phycisphaeraceae bacterium]
MRFETSQQMKLGQHMKLAPRMIQSMEILQLSIPALEERIEQELSSNVALEVVETARDGETPPKNDDNVDLLERELVVGDDKRGGDSDDFARLERFESTYAEALDNEYSSGVYNKDSGSNDWSKRAGARLAGERDRKLDAMANAEARPESFTEQLQRQWILSELDEFEQKLGSIIIDQLDEDGYLRTDLEAIANNYQQVDGKAITVEKLEEVLRKVQSFLEPPGLAARNIVECLLLQIDVIAEQEPDAADWDLIRTLITDHLDDLVQNRLPRIAQALDCDVEQIKNAMAGMQRLNPAPGRALVSKRTPRIIPDAIVEYDEEQDKYVVALTDGVLPNLRVSKVYERMSKDGELDKATREFIGKNLRNAKWLVEAIDQRNSTLLRVVKVVVEAQREFFDNGPKYLRPLPMTQVADQLGIHVATVSRAVADKWIQTPRGVFPLRQFFSGGKESTDGSNKSWEAVKAILKEIIDSEDKTKPFNDDELAAELGKRGIKLARRTVAKYRDQLGIPPARRRKQY